MKNSYRNCLLVTWIALMVLTVPVFTDSSHAADLMALPDGSSVDPAQKCPVCGMEVGGKDHQGVTVTFKDGRVVGFAGVAAAVFKDGHVVGFDGARCLFVYNSVPQKYNINVSDIVRQYVTDFGAKRMIELPKAFLVLGSEVKGLMGYELIPFNNEAAAREFALENDGKWIVQLHEVARSAQKEAESSAAPARGEALSKDEKAAPAPEARSEQVQPQERAADRAGKRSAPPRIQEPEPFYGGFGHHGGGHHGR